MDNITFEQFKHRDFAELTKAGFAGNLKVTLAQLAEGHSKKIVSKGDQRSAVGPHAIGDLSINGFPALGDEIKKARDFSRSADTRQKEQKSS
ncbi:hypothetical protein Pmar_PMAR003943 [Perkinsus marinus ATCC 50983]|uniref:Uncharacterized protein n=1 Tax=Perkinsus marinus (strain ATCC 50983 / TXsc) TaxID=423536 RepID=C5L862_PERM5|nr:hypothetical protein Pmar_PMAR003943 [Perkinsus marinus ATCC 50983]EER07088.1 hypothetical protein Pmar_PMAR003943 [Perkinsus marinus ATCC 50983]|eukprot:XP_002775272.1 hypothetical protein Pmar_PMAR003943 [Perkinsus marinus ATCC 50983]